MENTTVHTGQTIWVAEDGSWGTSPIKTIDTSKWSGGDWSEFDNATDDEKFDVIKYLAQKYELTITTFTP